MSPEPGRVVIPRIQRQPPRRALTAPGPVSQHDRLAVPSRRADQDQPQGQPLIRPAAAAAPGPAATLACAASSPARHPAPSQPARIEPPQTTQPSVPCTPRASGRYRTVVSSFSTTSSRSQQPRRQTAIAGAPAGPGPTVGAQRRRGRFHLMGTFGWRHAPSGFVACRARRRRARKVQMTVIKLEVRPNGTGATSQPASSVRR